MKRIFIPCGLLTILVLSYVVFGQVTAPPVADLVRAGKVPQNATADRLMRKPKKQTIRLFRRDFILAPPLAYFPSPIFAAIERASS